MKVISPKIIAEYTKDLVESGNINLFRIVRDSEVNKNVDKHKTIIIPFRTDCNYKYLYNREYYVIDKEDVEEKENGVIIHSKDRIFKLVLKRSSSIIDYNWKWIDLYQEVTGILIEKTKKPFLKENRIEPLNDKIYLLDISRFFPSSFFIEEENGEISQIKIILNMYPSTDELRVYSQYPPKVDMYGIDRKKNVFGIIKNDKDMICLGYF